VGGAGEAFGVEVLAPELDLAGAGGGGGAEAADDGVGPFIAFVVGVEQEDVAMRRRGSGDGREGRDEPQKYYKQRQTTLLLIWVSL